MNSHARFGLEASLAAAPGLTLTGDNDGNRLSGGANDDKIFGLGGTDFLYGKAGADILDGGDGTDFLDGGDGNDILRGGAGDDHLVSGRGSDILSGGSGDDYLSGGDGNDSFDGGDGNDVLDYISASAGINVSLGVTSAQDTGGSGMDTLRNIEDLGGSDFSDQLRGNSLDNFFYGAGGSDRIFGAGGADDIDGGLGNDMLHGGAGCDKLLGRAGADYYYFDTALNAVTNLDTISDWGKDANDKVFLDDAIFGQLAVGDLASSNFRASVSGNAADGNDVILYDTDDHTLYYDADGNGAGAKIAFAVLGTTDVTITAADIQIF